MEEFYFIISATENEHYIIENLIKNYCFKNEIELKYYRKFKNGHIPTMREIKICANKKSKIGYFKKFLTKESIKLC